MDGGKPQHESIADSESPLQRSHERSVNHGLNWSTEFLKRQHNPCRPIVFKLEPTHLIRKRDRFGTQEIFYCGPY